MAGIESRSSSYFTDCLILAYYAVKFLFFVIHADKFENRAINMAEKFHSSFMDMEHYMFHRQQIKKHTQILRPTYSHTRMYVYTYVDLFFTKFQILNKNKLNFILEKFKPYRCIGLVKFLFYILIVVN